MQNKAAYHILALAPLTPLPHETAKATIIKLDPAEPAAGLEQFSPVIRLATSPPVDFAPRSLDDFHPLNLLQSLDCFSTASSNSNSFSPEKDTPSMVENIMSMVDLPEADRDLSQTSSSSGAYSGKAKILRDLLADRQFQSLEAAWRGLALLSGQENKISLSAVSINRSNIQPILEDLTSKLINTPPDLIVLGLDLDASPLDLDIMRALADCADQLLTSVIFGLAPNFFGIESWSLENKLQYLPHELHKARYASFNSLKKHEGAQGLIPVTGGAPCRRLYSSEDSPFPFQDPGPPQVSPAFCLASTLIKKVLHSGWPLACASLPELEYNMPESRANELKNTGISAIAGLKGQIVSPQTLSSSNLFKQLCFSRLVGFLLRLRSEIEELQADLLSERIRQEFENLFALYNQELPVNTEIKTSYQDRERLILNVSLHIGREELSLAINW